MGGHVQQGNARTLHSRGVCGWPQEFAGVRRRHLDHRSDSCCKSCVEGLCAGDEVSALMTLTPVRRPRPSEVIKSYKDAHEEKVQDLKPLLQKEEPGKTADIIKEIFKLMAMASHTLFGAGRCWPGQDSRQHRWRV